VVGVFAEAFNRTHQQVELSSPNAELRVLEVFYHKIYKVLVHSDIAWLALYHIQCLLWFVLPEKKSFVTIAKYFVLLCCFNYMMFRTG
jgi:hypothetical protein